MFFVCFFTKLACYNIYVSKSTVYDIYQKKNNKDKRDGLYFKGENNMEFSIYVADLAEYNNGNLVGEWLDFLDIAANDFNTLAEALGYEEWAIHDTSISFPVKEVGNADEITDFCIALSNLFYNWEYETSLEEVLSAIGKELNISSLTEYQEVVEDLSRGEMVLEHMGEYLIGSDKEIALASKYLEEHYDAAEDEFLVGYVDKAKLGLDLSYDGYFIEGKDGNCYFIQNK